MSRDRMFGSRLTYGRRNKSSFLREKQEEQMLWDQQEASSGSNRSSVVLKESSHSKNNSVSSLAALKRRSSSNAFNNKENENIALPRKLDHAPRSRPISMVSTSSVSSTGSSTRTVLLDRVSKAFSSLSSDHGSRRASVVQQPPHTPKQQMNPESRWSMTTGTNTPSTQHGSTPAGRTSSLRRSFVENNLNSLLSGDNDLDLSLHQYAHDHPVNGAKPHSGDVSMESVQDTSHHSITIQDEELDHDVSMNSHPSNASLVSIVSKTGHGRKESATFYMLDPPQQQQTSSLHSLSQLSQHNTNNTCTSTSQHSTPYRQSLAPAQSLRQKISLMSLEKNEPLRRKHISKESISSPRELSKGEQRKGSTSSHSSFFSIKSFRSQNNQTYDDRTPSRSSTASSLASMSSAHSEMSIKRSFSDVRKSILSLRGSSSSSNSDSRGNRRSFLGKRSNDPAMAHVKAQISLPTPDNLSRDKLRNKLKASSSLLSLTRSETDSSQVVAMPFEDLQTTQLSTLLNLCDCGEVVDFSFFLDTVLSDHRQGALVKLAEASYSEVFSRGSSVFKIIPFGNDEQEQSPVKDIIQELTIAKTVQSLEGFVKVLGATVCRGKYPDHLIGLWDDYANFKGSESHRPDFYSENQLFCVVELANSGTDLEHFELESWMEAEYVFWRVVNSIAEAESKFQFEHRDLHWGNIVIQRTARPDIEEKLANMSLDDLDNAVFDDEDDFVAPNLKVTLIDYTLSRAQVPARYGIDDGAVTTVFTGLDHPDFFRGRGDYQFDIYRFMRVLINSATSELNSVVNCGASINSSHSSLSSVASNKRDSNETDWSLFAPKTNIMWLHYLATKLLDNKGLSHITTTRSGRLSFGTSNSSLRSAYLAGETMETGHHMSNPLEEARACKSLNTVTRCIDPRRKKLGGKRAGTAMVFQDFDSASDVLDWGYKNNLIPEGLL
ncbi:Serine/threonine-protein kinase haspin-like protein hrk1 [Yarrowia sp. C11]|nr:Serine/threonine-protein kinase haspin-like protein hrk1 [Yarrowia sp. C11]KAG5358700.1 Serine/threonine-protein kinase haspin-like protein hrk1 [Yarrowia sp. E02]